MGTFKICVYAICQNESQFVSRWMDSMGEADCVVVLDTGSQDDTVQQLRDRGALVTQEIITPWRFDTARNHSLALIPPGMDICVCTDLDEVFRPGWRHQLESVWRPGTGQARYRYAWSFNPDGSEGVVFWYEKIHAPTGYRWTHPVHEVLEWVGPGTPGPTVTAPGVQLDHHPDPTKSRAQYLSLLELAVREAPQDDRSAHYLGREYMFRGRWDDAIRMLKRHLDMPSATWADERCASMRFIARCLEAKGEVAQARDWYLRAIAQAPHLREPYVELARLLYNMEEWDGVLYFTGCALAITQRPDTYISQADAWGSLPHDLRALAFYRTGRFLSALKEGEAALALSPGEQRLADNLTFYRRAVGDKE